MPEGYALVKTVDMLKDKRLNNKIMAATGAGTLFLLAVGAVLALFVPPFKLTGEDVKNAPIYIILFCALQFVVVFVHELIHAGAMLLFTRGIKIGLKLPFAYAAAPKSFFTRPQYAFISVLPLVLITAALSVLMFMFPPMTNLLLYGVSAMHLPGCFGDVYMFVLTLKSKSGTLICDSGVDMKIYEKIYR